jgi:hypothetical protein
MTKVLDRWTVLPRGPLEAIDDGLLTVTGEIHMPFGNFPRRMTVIALRDGRTAIWSAIAQPEPEMARIEALGKPSVLIVPNPGHRLDAKIWKQRYPDLVVLTPPGARERVSEVVPVDAAEGGATVLADPDVAFVIVPGLAEKEAALVVRRPSGTTLITNDIIGHVRHPHGMGATVMAHVLNWGTSAPTIPKTAHVYIKDKAALAAQLRDWAGLPALKRIIVSHGEPITDDPAGVLRRLAAELGR